MRPGGRNEYIRDRQLARLAGAYLHLPQSKGGGLPWLTRIGESLDPLILKNSAPLAQVLSQRWTERLAAAVGPPNVLPLT